jgi:hypothetical protein
MVNDGRVWHDACMNMIPLLRRFFFVCCLPLLASAESVRPVTLPVFDDGLIRYDRFGLRAVVSGEWAAVLLSNSNTSSFTMKLKLMKRGTDGWQVKQVISGLGFKNYYEGSVPFALQGDTLVVAGMQTGTSIFIRHGERWVEQVKINASGGIAALDGDTLVIGDASADSAAGLAQVYVRSGSGWSLEATLLAAARENMSYFGSSLALQGDTLVIGSSPQGSSLPGMVDCFSRSAGVWTRRSTLVAPSALAGSFFGAALALTGDWLLVSEPFLSNTPNAVSGRVYACKRDSSTGQWSVAQTLTFAGTNDGFGSYGRHLAAQGTEAVVSMRSTTSIGALQVLRLNAGGTAWEDDVLLRPSVASFRTSCLTLNENELWAGDETHLLSSHQGGRVERYTRTGSGAAWSRREPVAPPLWKADTYHYATRVAMHGGVVAAVAESTTQPRRVIIHEPLSSDAWDLTGVLECPDPAHAAQFGRAVSVHGQSVLVGAGGPGSGMAYLFSKDSFEWRQEPTFTPAAQSSLGTAVALGDGLAVLGVPQARLMRTMVRQDSLWEPGPEIAPAGAPPGLGSALALSGETLVSGGDGVVFIHARSKGVWTQQARLTPPAVTGLPGFGAQLAAHGDWVAVGVPGEVYVYLRKGKAWTLFTTLRDKSEQPISAGAAWGEFVSMNDGLLLVGGRGASLRTLYAMGPTLPWVPLRQFPFYPQAEDTLGSGVAVSREAAVVPGPEWESQLSYPTATIRTLLAYRLGLAAELYDGAVHENQRLTLEQETGTLEPLLMPSVGAGGTSRRTLIVRNSGSLAFTITGATFSGTFGDSPFSFSALLPTTSKLLAPGASLAIQLRCTPPFEFQHTATLQITTDAGSALPLSLKVVTYVLPKLKAAAQIHGIQSWEPQNGIDRVLLPIGSHSGISGDITGDAVPRLQWFFNGRAISGATGARLSLPNLQPANVGTYHLTARNHSTATSLPIHLSLYQPQWQQLIGNVGKPLSIAVKTWTRPGVLGYEWRDAANNLLEDGDVFTGTRTATLTVLKSEDCPAEVRCFVQAGSALPVLGTIARAIVRHPPTITGVPFQGAWAIGQSVAGLGVATTGEVTLFTATGLPAGVKLSPTTGMLSGAPTTAGHHRVSFTATNAAGSSAPYDVDVFVSTAAPAFLPGTWIGELPAPEGGLHGAVTVTVQTTGKFTGQIRLGSKAHPITGQLVPLTVGVDELGSAEGTVGTGNGAMSFAIRQDRTKPMLTILRSPNTPAETSHIAWPVLPAHLLRSVPKTRLFNTGLSLISALPADPQLHPEGLGYLTCTIKPTGSAALAATLPDGTTATAGTNIVDKRTDFQLPPVPAMSALFADAAASHSAGFQATLGQSTLSGSLGWVRLRGINARTYPNGFRCEFSASGRVFTPPSAGKFLPGPGDNPDFFPLSLTLGDISSAMQKNEVLYRHLHMDNARRVRISTPPNPTGLTVSVSATTGLVTGSFTLRDPALDGSARTDSRVVRFQALFPSFDQDADGFFLLPAQPDPFASPTTTAKTAPIRSGRVKLDL